MATNELLRAVRSSVHKKLLNAMTQFWDLSGAGEDATFSTFVRQDYIRGLIAGVRYVLEHADCLHRDATLVQQHTGVRRMRKGLLADLSTLVQIAKRLQETISEPFAGEVIHYLLEDLIAKAFKVVTRAVGFVDQWAIETAAKNITFPRALSDIDPTTPLQERDCLSVNTHSSSRIAVERPLDSAKYLPSIDETVSTGAIISAAVVTGRSTTRPPNPATSHRVSVAHRLSQLELDQSRLASSQLAKAHDICISLIGTFIGHHLHARRSSELAQTTARLVGACQTMLAIAQQVHSRDPHRSKSVQHARTLLQEKLEELVRCTKDVFQFSDVEDGVLVMLPDQSTRLVLVGTSLIRTAGDCVLKTRSLIEQIGDFELDAATQALATVSDQSPDAFSDRVDSANGSDEDCMAQGQMRPSGKRSPALSNAVKAQTDAVDFAGGVPDGTPATTTSAGAISGVPRPARSSTIQPSISGDMLKRTVSSQTILEQPDRKNSVGVSIAGSAETHRSSMRNSNVSAVSEASTRATTPDRAQPSLSPEVDLLHSFCSTSSFRSTADIGDDAEADLLRKTYASELILNKDGQISGGSLDALVEQLTTHDSTPDPQFVSAFYITFRMFATPRQFAQALIARFDYVGEDKTVCTSVRLRVYNAFKGWVETYWSTVDDKDALGDIRYFAVHKLRPHLPSAGDRLVELVRKVAANYESGITSGPLVSGVGKTSMSIGIQTTGDAVMPEPIITKSQRIALRSTGGTGSGVVFADLEPLELARQLTLLTSKIFCDIQADELLSLDWNKRNTQQARNVKKMCNINTDLAHVVGDTILGPDEPKKRALTIKHWTKVAYCCLELNNYDSMMAIVCSLNCSMIQRLKRTWEQVSKKTQARLSEMNALVDPSMNHQALRKRQEAPVAPCIPFMGIYLTDLTFLDAGNPATRELPGTASASGEAIAVINFDKYMRMAKVVCQLQRFQIPYKLKAVQELQAWTEMHLQRMHQNENELVGTFHRRSLIVEPRMPKVPKRDDADTVGGDERPKTSAGNKERFESFLRNNSFGFRTQIATEAVD